MHFVFHDLQFVKSKRDDSAIAEQDLVLLDLMIGKVEFVIEPMHSESCLDTTAKKCENPARNSTTERLGTDRGERTTRHGRPVGPHDMSRPAWMAGKPCRAGPPIFHPQTMALNWAPARRPYAMPQGTIQVRGISLRELLPEADAAGAGDPRVASRRLKVIGIAGTRGKTTTCCLTASVLSAAGFRPAVLPAIDDSGGADAMAASWTMPPADALVRCLAQMEAGGCTHAVMEVSCQALEQDHVAGIEFDVACITNVESPHLGCQGAPRRYRRTLASLLERLRPEGCAVINADDPAAAAMLVHAEGPALTTGIDRAAEITARMLEQRAGEQVFLLSSGRHTIPVRTSLTGRHNVSNCLIAAAVGLTYAIDLATIVRGLEWLRMPQPQNEPLRASA